MYKGASLWGYNNEESPRYTSVSLLPRTQIKRAMELSVERYWQIILSDKNYLAKQIVTVGTCAINQIKTDCTNLQFNLARLMKEMMNHSLLPVTTNLKFADYLKSLERESSLSLAACTCFSK